MGSERHRSDRPDLSAEMSVEDYRDHYYLKNELTAFARKLGLATHGDKPQLSARIERRLQGLPNEQGKKSSPRGPRDSDRPLTRDTPVVHYKNDARTRAFFERETGPEFHFTYHVNQYRLNHVDLTYGDLVDAWLAERDRRNSDDYQAPIASHGKYNRFVRAFFADLANAGKTIEDVAAAWNEARRKRGDPEYRPEGED